MCENLGKLGTMGGADFGLSHFWSSTYDLDPTQIVY